MIDITQYYGVLIAMVAGIFAAIVGWKMSGESFSEMKFLRTVFLGTLVALGLSVTGLTGTYSTASISTIVGLFGSKALNMLNEVPVTVKQDIQTVAQTAVDATQKSQPALTTPPSATPTVQPPAAGPPATTS